MTPAGHWDTCLSDSSGVDWFACHRGTVGCPRFHNDLSPHCIACASGDPCRYNHGPAALEMTLYAYHQWTVRAPLAGSGEAA